MQAVTPAGDVQDPLSLNFLKFYPFPAWVSAPPQDEATSTRKGGFSVLPAWSNPAFDALFRTHEGLLLALGGPGQQLLAYATWLEESQAYPKTLQLSLTLPADSLDTSNSAQVKLELTRTVISAADGRDYVVCTSTSREVLPDTGMLPQSTPRGRKQRKIRAMKLRDLPSFRSTTGISSTPGSSGDSSSDSMIYSHDLGPGGGPRMVDLVQTFPWETTPLGPRDKWDVCLKQAAELTLNSPYPASIWWGQDLVMLYNDAYAVMSTTKHPRIFGLNGIDAWGEIWDSLGPAMVECMKGNPVYRRDGK